MAGHSKWATIKHKKSLLDSKKGKIFSKIAREILVSVKMGGGNPDHNPRLKLAISKARQYEMPSKNVNSAIKRGCGSEDKQHYFEIRYEGYGPYGVALIIDCLTDNKNRTVADVRSILEKSGGRLGESGCVGWQFTQRGCIGVQCQGDAEALLQLVIDVGGQDMSSEEEGFLILTEPKNFSTVFKSMQGVDSLEILHAELSMIPHSFVDITESKMREITFVMSTLEDVDDVQSVVCNARIVV